MASKFTQEDLYQSDIYGDLRTSLEKTIEVYNKADREAKELHDNLNKGAQAAQMNAKGMRDLNKANLDSDRVLKEQNKVLEQKKKLQVELNNISKKEKQELASLRLEKQRQNKILKEEAILISGTSTLYEKQSIKLKRLRDDYKDLVLKEGGATRATKKLAKEITQLDTRLKSVDKAVGQSQRNVGNYSQALGGAVTKLKNFAAALGVVAGVQLFTRVLKNSFDVVRNFDQAQADLSAVLSVNKDEMADLTAQAKELGETTKFTASEVSNLQLELAKLGFTQTQIQEMTGATLELAAAAGTDLANAATIVGSTLRGFGLEADQTQRLVDVMAKSFSSSSLDIDKFASAMSNVAPAAAAMGLTVEETTALIGTLTDAGIDASSAGTGLRNMFLESKKQGIDFEDALNKIANSTDQLGTSFNIFGKKGSTLGVILANNQEQTAGLTETLDDAAGAAGEMADKQLDTLNGSLDLLNSAWEGFILGADGSTGASETLKNMISFLAKNLKTIIKILIGAIKVWALYKLQTKLAGLAMKFYRIETIKGIAVSKGLIPNLIRSAKGFRLASISVRGFGNALKSIPFLAIISGITTAISLFTSFGQSADDGTDSMGGLREETSALDSAMKELEEGIVKEQVEMTGLFQAIQNTNAGSKERQEILDEINSKYGTTLQNLSDETQFAKELEIAYNAVNDALKEKLRIQIGMEKRTALLTELIHLENKLAEAEGLRSAIEEAPILENFNSVQEALTFIEQESPNVLKRIEDINFLLKGLNDIPLFPEDNGDGGTGGKTPEQRAKDRMAAIKKANDLFLLELEAELLRQGKSRKEIDDRISKERLDSTADELLTARFLLGESHAETIKLLNKFEKDRRKIEDIEQKDKETAIKNADADDKKRFDELKKANELELKELETSLIQQGLKREEIDEMLADRRLEILEDERDAALEIFGEGSEQFIAADNKFANALLKQREDQQKELADARKKRQEQLKKDAQETIRILKEVTQFIVDNIDRQIAARKKNVADSQTEQDRLAELARNGNADAAEALVAERQREAREEIAIDALEKKKVNLLITIAALENASRLINSGDGNPFKNTSSALSDFLSSLPKLAEGTDQTLAHKLGYKPGVDSHLIWADNNEMILNEGKVNELKNAGLYTTDAITRAALMAQNKPTLRHVVKEKKEHRPVALLNAMNKQTQAILDLPKKMPHTDIDLVALVKTMTDGNKVTRDHIRNKGIEF
jgi:Phage-related minor tail protein